MRSVHRHRHRHSVRAAALAVAALAATGCAAATAKAHQPRPEQPTAKPQSPSPAAVDPSASAPPITQAAPARATAPRGARYRIAASESYAPRKREAVRIALALTNYGPDTSPDAIARTVSKDPARRPALLESARPLLHRGAASTGTIVYPQMGGATADRASVMVVVRQVVDGRVETRVLDVRVVLSGGRWQLDELASAGGTPMARPDSLPAAARAVLDDERIFLPDSARWDIYRGLISTDLLTLMAQIADRGPYAVAVLETGHPHNVFGSDHQSAHTSGRAVDIRGFAGRNVIVQQSRRSPTYGLVEWLLAKPQVRQVGSPWNLDGGSSRSFANEVHLDHVHVAV